MKRALEQIEIPGAEAAEARAAALVTAAFAERRPEPPPRRSRRPLAAVAVAAALVVALISPAGQAFVDQVRRAVGIDHASRALFSLPAGGELLVASDSGVWVAHPDGSRRLLGSYAEATWSPFGRFVAASRQDELATLEPDGSIRWSLARPLVHFPRWAGTAVDTRIAYLSGSRLHVVAGDGTDDVDFGGLPATAEVPPAWRKGPGFELAYADTHGRVRSVLTSKGGEIWRSRPFASPRTLEWSSDGQELLVLSRMTISVLRGTNGSLLSDRPANGTSAVAFRPGTHTVAELSRPGEVSRVTLGGRLVFSAATELRGLTWSPDGRFILVGSPEADQWVFISADDGRIVAVSNISTQFRSRSFPRVDGWCCSE